MFKAITGEEKYRVVDLVTGGERHDETREELLRSIWFFASYLRHSCEVYEHGKFSMSFSVNPNP